MIPAFQPPTEFTFTWDQDAWENCIEETTKLKTYPQGLKFTDAFVEALRVNLYDVNPFCVFNSKRNNLLSIKSDHVFTGYWYCSHPYCFRPVMIKGYRCSDGRIKFHVE